ncbi:MAG: hypothetical protein B6245_16310, partial [Desulfobacteraceae bacterium 4572_88]
MLAGISAALHALSEYAGMIGVLKTISPSIDSCLTVGKFPYAKFWNEGFSMDLDNPKGIYRANCLARINAADKISTPKAQAELEEFREKFGRPTQATLLYHWARLIEEVYACEHAIDLLNDPEITDTN